MDSMRWSWLSAGGQVLVSVKISLLSWCSFGGGFGGGILRFLSALLANFARRFAAATEGSSFLRGLPLPIV